MLDAIRYMICWMPIILTTMHFAFKAVGLEQAAEAENAVFESALLNETLASNLTSVSGQIQNQTFISA